MALLIELFLDNAIEIDLTGDCTIFFCISITTTKNNALKHDLNHNFCHSYDRNPYSLMIRTKFCCSFLNKNQNFPKNID